MPIKAATQEQIAQMRTRLQNKRDDRIAEIQMDEVVRMVQKKPPFVQAPAPGLDWLLFLALGVAGAIAWNTLSSYTALAISIVSTVLAIINFKKEIKNGMA